MDEQFDGESTERPKSGCGKWLGGCLVLVVLAAIGIGYVVMKWPELERWAVAQALTSGIELVIDQSLQLPPDEREAVMKPIEELARQVSAGEIEIEVARGTLTRALESNEVAAVVVHAFESRYIDADLIPEAEREEAMLTANRFATGILDRRIPRSQLEPLAELVIEQQDVEEEGVLSPKYRLKDPLGEADIRLALSHMQEAVMAAGVDDPYVERGPEELSALVDHAIDRALIEERSQAPAPPLPQPESQQPDAPPGAPRIQPRPPRNDEDLGPAL